MGRIRRGRSRLPRATLNLPKPTTTRRSRSKSTDFNTGSTIPLRTQRTRPKISARILAKKRTIRRQPPGKIISRSRLPQKVSRVPQAEVTQFGGGSSSAIKNVFGIIEQTSARNAAKREQFKREGRIGSIFFDSFFDEEFL